MPGLRRWGAPRSIFLGAAGCICVLGLPRYPKASVALFGSFWVSMELHLWPFRGQNAKILGSWGVRGASGSHDGPDGQPERSMWAKMDEKGHPWDSILDPIFDTFPVFDCFFGRRDFQSVFGWLFGSILKRLGVILSCIFWICGITVSMRSQKCKMWFGVIICYESST